MLQPGALVHQRYRIARSIGEGGMGAVYEAADTRLHCAVALKHTHARRGAYPELDRAFEHEARLLAALRHPALPVVTDYFVEGDDQFLAMQFIPGEDLATALKRRSMGFPLEEVIDWWRRLLDALEYLHGHQPPIVHRDIKPANLKLTDRGELVLLDFGLAKGKVGAATDATTTASVMGYTPRYSPLEQIQGLGTGPSSDIYALGATVYHLLTGVAPPTAVERAGAALAGRPDPLRPAHSVSPDIPEGLSGLIARAMALDPAERIESARDVRRALDAAEADTTGGRARRRPGSRPRRIDAAVPSQAQVGARIDLFVQVRFADSPRLGLEDWPLRHRPAAIEQVSEHVALVFPPDPVTGLPLPARLEVKVVAPDFTVEGQAQQVIDVPPEEYSKRVAFLLTARRPGFCRINVEVYGAGAVYLGAVPVETEVQGEPVGETTVAVANLLLEVLARQVPGLVPPWPAPVEEALAAHARQPDPPRTASPVPMAPASMAPPLSDTMPAAEKEITAVPLASPVRSTRAADEAEWPVRPAPPARSVAPTRVSRIARRPARILMGASAAAAVMVMAVGTIYLLNTATSPGVPSSQTAQRQPADVSAPTAVPAAPAAPAAAPTLRPGASAGRAAAPLPAAAVPPAPPVPGALAAHGAPAAAASVPPPNVTRPASPPARRLPLSAEELAKKDILRLLEGYRNAYERMDLDGIRRTFPDAPVKDLRTAFLGYTSLQYVFEATPEFDEVDVRSGIARVRVRSMLIPRAASGSRFPYRREETFTLQMRNGVWLITASTQKPAG